jgi:hypothetical protein
MRGLSIKLASMIAVCAALAACGSSPEDRAGSGAAIGAGSGAVIGALAGGIGAIPGALIGGAVGAGTGVATNDRQIDLGTPVWKR